MLNVCRVKSLDAPGLEPYRTLRQSRERWREGLFIAEGEKVVRRLLESPLAVVSLLMPEKWLEEYRPLLERRSEPIQIYLASKPLLEKMTGFTFYQGVLSVGKIPPPVSIGALLGKKNEALLVAADGISSAQNLGSLARNCAALGVDGMIVGETSCSPYLSGAVRSSMGTIFKLPVHDSVCLAKTFDELKQHGVRCIGAHPHTRAGMQSRADFRGSCCIVFGSEGDGLSQAVLEKCDELIAIPMADGIDSLNVASAAAVFFYEANRQRGNG